MFSKFWRNFYGRSWASTREMTQLFPLWLVSLRLGENQAVYRLEFVIFFSFLFFLNFILGNKESFSLFLSRFCLLFVPPRDCVDFGRFVWIFGAYNILYYLNHCFFLFFFSKKQKEIRQCWVKNKNKWKTIDSEGETINHVSSFFPPLFRRLVTLFLKLGKKKTITIRFSCSWRFVICCMSKLLNQPINGSVLGQKKFVCNSHEVSNETLIIFRMVVVVVVECSP